MTPDFFVDVLKKSCRDDAVEDCVAAFESPPGRRPREQLVKISRWFNALSPADRELVIAAMREASDATLFLISNERQHVIPAEAGIQSAVVLDTGLRRCDGTKVSPQKGKLTFIANQDSFWSALHY